MTVTVSKESGNTTFAFQIVGLSTKIDPLLDAWTKYVWEHGSGIAGVSYASATSQQKFDALNARLKALGLAEANTQEINDDVEVARLAAPRHDLSGIS